MFYSFNKPKCNISCQGDESFLIYFNFHQWFTFPDEGPTFAQLDLNGDGVIKLNEIPSTEERKLMFEQVDANEDGEVNEEEFETYKAKMMNGELINK